jgi:sensor histidine kinase YesM
MKKPLGETRRVHKSFWKKKFYTDPQFQGNFVLFMILMAVGIMGILYIANLIWLWRFYYISDVMDLPSNFNFEKFMDEQLYLMNTVFLGTSLLVLPILSVVAVLLSHKIAGPLYRLRNHIIFNSKVAKEKNLKFIHFRKKDHFQTLARAYNEQVKLIKKLKFELEQKTETKEEVEKREAS